MNTKNIFKITTTLALSAGLLACASKPPVELIDARNAYSTSEKGPASQYAQSNLEVAKAALGRAEAAFKDDGNEPKTRDLAYIAQRQAQIADAQAQVAIAKQQKVEADRNLVVANKQIQHQTQEELARTKEQLADTSAQRAMEQQKTEAVQDKLAASKEVNANNQQKLDTTTAALETERKARVEAEKRATEARTELNRIADVRDEERGMVINLSGNVLFASGKTQLLTSATVQLTQVSTALKGMVGRRILIEGHTDSVGSDDTNQRLSQLRAESVRDFLVRNGVERDRIEAVGVGESRPKADNATPEGRAINRRVEIVLQNATS